MNEYGKFAISVAKKGGSLLRDCLYDVHKIDYKGEIDIVTEVDRLSEELIVSMINKEFPLHDITAEESEKTEKGSEYRWLIDPLDGTTNYAHGFPFFCVSIALERSGEIIVGVIYNPMLDQLFVAQKGQGAFLDGKKISVSDRAKLSASLLATGFPYDIRNNPDNNINYFSGMALEARAIRRAGSAALDLAYVAAGWFDGFWELKLHPWDTAAGWLLVSEAGGRVSNISGNDYFLESPTVLASNGKIHDDMIRIFNNIDPFDKRLVS